MPKRDLERIADPAQRLTAAEAALVDLAAEIEAVEEIPLGAEAEVERLRRAQVARLGQ